MIFNKSRLLYLCVLTHIAVSTKGQTVAGNKPGVETQVPFVSGQPHIPTGYPNGQIPFVNFVRERDGIARIQNVTIFDNAGYQDVKQSTTYVDGLGRSYQVVQKQATSGSNPVDMVSLVDYDPYGREQFKYLPYAVNGGNASDGGVKLDPFNSQKNFFENIYPNEQPAYTGEKYYYTQNEYEGSPLNRVSKSMGAGNSWVGSGMGITQQYLVNNGNDHVVIWSISNDPLTFSNNDLTTNIPVANGYYPAGVLNKHVSTDENGHSIVEYKDKDGLLILKKVQAGAVASDFSGYDGWLSTYYIYDDLNQLRFVIQPKGVGSLINNGWDLTTDQTIIEELCFRYEFDARKRMIAKKAPGAGWVYMVYDQRDRAVYTQDANIRRTNQWLTSLYDGLDRIVATGMIVYAGTRADLQAYVTSNTGGGITSQTTVGGASPASIPQQLLLASNDNGMRQAAGEIILDNGFETPDVVDFTAEIVSANDAAVPFSAPLQVTDNPIPNSSFIGLSLTFYDNYNNSAGRKYSVASNTLLDAGTNLHAETLPTLSDQQKVGTKGLVTATSVRILEDPADFSKGKWLTTVNFYDDRSRLIQTQSDNIRGGSQILTQMYNFSGQVICSYLKHDNPLATINNNMRVKTGYNYDHINRLLETYKTINDDNSSKRLIAKSEYDQLAQVKKKSLGQLLADGSFLETQDLCYNIRGWLKGINKDYSNNDNSHGANDRWFGMELAYDWGFDHNQLAGNISGVKWRSKGDGVQRAYGLGYDPLNRILSADFNQVSAGGWDRSANIDFSVMMGNGVDPATAYDENGNIKYMQQNGWQIGGSHPIDQLTYTYNANSNKLLNVIDAQNDPLTKMGDFRTSSLSPYHTAKTSSAIDYAYDFNGNLSKDLNKDIGSESNDGIVYNHLNLPFQVTFRSATGTKGTIKYLYDAAGNKLEKLTTDNDGNIQTNTIYIDGFQYGQTGPLDGGQSSGADILQFFGHEEGRVRILSGSQVQVSQNPFVFDYFLKDHLGNTRMVLTEEKEMDQYPMATMESANLQSEELYYSNLSESQYDIPAGYPTDNTTNPNNKVARLNGSPTGHRIGPGITLKVMAGDKFSIKASSWYKLNGTSPGTSVTPLSDVVNSLISGIGGISGGGHPSLNALQANSTAISNNVNDFLSDKTGLIEQSRPSAFVNWVLFDNQFNYVKEASGFEQVGSDMEFKFHNKPDLAVAKSGYLYIYLSNETPNVDVFFDNLQVTHTRGPLLEEEHYYPFGLTMAGISDKALKSGYAVNKIRFQKQELQSEEFADGSGLDMYEFKYRFDDPQIGRFWSIDPLAHEYVYNGGYVFSENKVTGHVELEGLESVNATDIQNPYLRASLHAEVQKKVEKFNSNASGAINWKVTLGPGIGIGGELGGNGATWGVNGPQISVSGDVSGPKKAEGNMFGAGIATKGFLPTQIGVSVMSVTAENGEIQGQWVKAGVKTGVGLGEKKEEDGPPEDASIKRSGIGVNAQVGIVGVEVKADPEKAAKATVGFWDVIIEYVRSAGDEAKKAFFGKHGKQN